MVNMSDEKSVLVSKCESTRSQFDYFSEELDSHGATLVSRILDTVSRINREAHNRHNPYTSR